MSRASHSGPPSRPWCPLSGRFATASAPARTVPGVRPRDRRTPFHEMASGVERWLGFASAGEPRDVAVGGMEGLHLQVAEGPRRSRDQARDSIGMFASVGPDGDARWPGFPAAVPVASIGGALDLIVQEAVDAADPAWAEALDERVDADSVVCVRMRQDHRLDRVLGGLDQAEARGSTRGFSDASA